MSSVNLNNLSQEELNKILKEEYEKNKKLKERSILLIKSFKNKMKSCLNQNQNKNKKRKISLTIIKSI